MILSPVASFCLDFIRILAAQAVLLGHLIHSHELFRWLEPPTTPYMQNIAVVIFFLISGFLIAYSLNNKFNLGNYRFTDYVFGRYRRIYGIFLPALLLVIILDWLVLRLKPEAYLYAGAFNFKTLITNVLMLQYFPSIPFGSGRPFWALPLLWWSYLAYGWWVLSRRRAAGLIFLAIPVYSLFYGRGQGLVLVWLMGVLIYRLLAAKQLRPLKPWLSLLISIALMLLAGFRVKQTMREYELIFAMLLSGTLVFLLNGLQGFTWKINDFWRRAAKFFAGYSLTLYLTHFSINTFILALSGQKSSPAKLILVWVVANLAAILLTRWSEQLVARIRPN